MTVDQLHDLHRATGSPYLPIRECRWVDFLGTRGEIDILIEMAEVAIECKVRGSGSRVNWEEALGQALRDLELPFVRVAYVAMPANELTDIALATCAANGVGVIAVDNLSGSSTAKVWFASHGARFRSEADGALAG